MTAQEIEALKYPNFTLEYVKDKVMYQQFFTRGKNYYNKGHVTELHFNETANRFNATVRGRYYYSCTLTFKNGKLTYHRCDCPAHDTYDGLCKHIVAVMLEIYYRRKDALKKRRAENNSTNQVKSDFIDTIADTQQKEPTITTIKPQTPYTPPQPKIDTTYNSQNTPPPKEKPQETKPKRKRLSKINMSVFWIVIGIALALCILPLALTIEISASVSEGIIGFFVLLILECIIIAILGKFF